MEQLAHLSLDRTQLMTLDDVALPHTLTYLSLAGNFLTSLLSQDLPRLLFLDLTRNSVSRLGINAFRFESAHVGLFQN